MILPGWLKKRPQQGAGKCVSKHGSSQHSQALLGLALRLEAAPEGRSPTWGRGEGGGPTSLIQAQGLSRRHQSLPFRGAGAPKGLPQPLLELTWRSYSYTHVSTCPTAPGGTGPTPGFLCHPHAAEWVLSTAPAGQPRAPRAGSGVGHICRDSLLRGLRAAPR